MSEKLPTPTQIFLACFAIASIAGIAALLRSNKVLDVRTIVAATLYSGLFGLIIGLTWYNYFAPTEMYFLVGISGLAGLGGVSVLDVILYLITKGANISVKIDHVNDDQDD